MFSKSKIYRAAIIGCGNIGSLFDKKMVVGKAFSHAGAYFLCPKIKLVAASDLNPKKLFNFKDKWRVESVYLNFKHMLKKEKIDILSICTPPATHWPIIRLASMQPIKAVYCEKPIAYTIQETDKMIEICKKNKILLIVNHQRRFDPFFQEIKDKITNNFFGNIQQVNCYYTRGIFNTGVHIIDLYCFFFGEPEWVMAFPCLNKSPFRKDPNIDGLIKFKNGPLVSLRGCDDSNYLILEIDILGSAARLKIGKNLEYFKTIKSKNGFKMKILKKIEKLPFNTTYGTISLTNGVKHIINCLENKETPLSSGETALGSIKIINAMMKSLKTEKIIYF